MFFQKSMSSALVLGLVLQNSVFVIPASADELTSDATQVVSAEQIPVSKPIYHIALTPREVSDLGVEGLKGELLKYSEATQAESTANTISTLVGKALVLTATTAAYYWVTEAAWERAAPTFKFSEFPLVPLQKVPMEIHELPSEKHKKRNAIAKFNAAALRKNRSIVKWKLYFVSLNNFEKVVFKVMDGIGAEHPVTKAQVLMGAVAAANAALLPFHFLRFFIAEQFVYPISKSDKSRLENAFELVQTHADNSCLQAQTEKSVDADKAMIQSMHFSDDDIVNGRVYLDGRPLTLALAKELKSSQNNEYYVFNTPIVCKTGYFSSMDLDSLMPLSSR